MHHSESMLVHEGHKEENTAAASVDALGHEKSPTSKDKAASLQLQQTLENWRLSAVTGDTIRGPNGEDLGRRGSPAFLEGVGMKLAAHPKAPAMGVSSGMKSDVLKPEGMHGELAFAPQHQIVMSVGVQGPLQCTAEAASTVPHQEEMFHPGSVETEASGSSNTRDVGILSSACEGGEASLPTESYTIPPICADDSTGQGSLRHTGDWEGVAVAAASMIPKPSGGFALPVLL